MQEVKYISESVAEQTVYKSVYDEWNRDRFSIVVFNNNVFYIESRGCADRTYKLVVKETKRIYPELKYLYDIPAVR